MSDTDIEDTNITSKDTIIRSEISSVMKRSYLNYAMSVIVSRALPDVRDGLKPVHRRILYAMYKLGLFHRSKFSKSAKVVGEVLGKYHPHGDLPVYDALVRMAQTFSMRYPLVLGQGNFGSIDGDPPAAMRYTEVKLSKIADELLFDIDKDTVSWEDNFDATLKEPIVLPSKLPNLLLMGAEGIAVGMATKIPPHNLIEVVDGVITLIDSRSKKVPEKDQIADVTTISYQPPSNEELTVPELINYDKEDSVLSTEIQNVYLTAGLQELQNHIKGPDFPTAGILFGKEDILSAYATGKGKMLIRGKADLEETTKGKQKIVITELPYQTNKANLVKKIADLVRDKKLIGISDLRDESDREGIRVVVELKKDASYNRVLNNLYKHTELETSYPMNMVTLVNGIPQTVSLLTVLEEYIKHRIEIIKRRSIFEMLSAKKRAHILQGLLKALDHIDEIIELIKKSKTEDEAKTGLISKFGFSPMQAQAILDMQLKRLTGLEKQKIIDELTELQKKIKDLILLVTDVTHILKVITSELMELKKTYTSPRLTKIVATRPGSMVDEQLIENKEVIITLTKEGYIKSIPRDTFKVQGRGGKGVSGMETKEDDNVYNILAAQMHDYILFFSDKGKVYQTRVWEIPVGTRISKGKAIINTIALSPDEKITSILTYSGEEKNEKNSILMITKQGTVKKTLISDFKNIRSSGINAIKLSVDDKLLLAKIVDGNQKIIIATYLGKAIVCKESDIRVMGRTAHGVRGIKLDKGDYIIASDIFSNISENSVLIIMSENGIGKVTKIRLFPVQRRGGKGVKLASQDEKTGPLAYAAIREDKKETLLITSKNGQVVKIPFKTIPSLSRVAKGVILMRFNNKADKVASATQL